MSLETELLAAARDELPPYMVPTAIVVVPAFPLTPNRKIDVAALPVPSVGVGAADAADAGDETGTAGDGADGGEDADAGDALQGEIVERWRALLGRPSLDPAESFFASGGHSLQAARMLTEVRREYGVRVPPDEFFADPTARSLARLINGRRR